MADRYWVGGSGSWSDTNHWSTTSGGSGGASVPGDGDNVYIDTNSGSGDFAVDINVETANLAMLYITYPASKGVLTINQWKRFNCYWNALQGVYHQGGLISGNSTTGYSKVRWTKKSSVSPDYEMRLTRFVVWGNMTSTDDGFALVTAGTTDCFDIHIYGTDCRRNSRAWIYRMNFYIHTPATVTNPNNSNTVYGCDVSFSQNILSLVLLYVYNGAKIACDWQNHGGYSPAMYGLYIGQGGGLTIESGGSIDTGITIEGTISTLNLPSGFVFPRFLRFQGTPTTGWTWVGGDIEVADNLPVGKGYVAFSSTYTANATGILNMNGKRVKAPKVTIGPVSPGINDVTPVLTSTSGSKVYNISEVDTKELYICGSASTSAENTLVLASGGVIRNTYTETGVNITIYTGGGRGGMLDMSATGTSLESGILNLSHTAYANNITFKTPTQEWKCYGNITFGGKVSYTYNGCNINIKNNLTIDNSANTNARQWGNLAVDAGKILTVNGVIETINGVFEDGQVAVGTNSRLISKNHGGVAKYNRVYGKATWSSPAYYTFATVQDLSEGIVLDIRKPSSGATEFGFDVDNVGVKKVQVQAGASWGVYSGCDVYANELDDRGTLLTALPYGGRLWLNISPTLPFRPIDPEYVDGEFDVCPTPVDFARGVD